MAGGRFKISKYTGQRDIDEDLKRSTPSVDRDDARRLELEKYQSSLISGFNVAPSQTSCIFSSLLFFSCCKESQ